MNIASDGALGAGDDLSIAILTGHDHQCSLAFRLRDAGVADVVICEYVNIDQVALNGIYRIAEAKLLAAQKALEGLHRGRPWRGNPRPSGQGPIGT